MSILTIVKEPDPILRKKSLPVKEVNGEIKKLMKNMLETMYTAPGIGLAAVQVGILKRIIVIDISGESSLKKPIFFVNPKIVWKSDILETKQEGCLSIPGHFGNIKRPEACHVKYLDYSGKEKTLKADGLLATCIQHEIDHCNGTLFIDYLSKLKKAFIIKKLTKAQKNQE
jgi:peptide deformylase